MKIEAYNINEIAAIVNGKLVHYENNAIIQQVIYDTRTLFVAQGSVFIALSSSKRNGHHFIQDAYAKGIRNFIIDEEVDFHFEEANVIRVSNVLDALQVWAKHHRKSIKSPVIAITGSNGKTTLKEWLFQLLSPYFRISRSPRSFNSQLGVPLSVLQISTADKLAIIEVGISGPGEMEKLEQIVQPDICILTNVLEAHAVNFKSREQHITEKLKLAKNAGSLICCSDDVAIMEQAQFMDCRKLSWSNFAGDLRFSFNGKKLFFHHFNHDTEFDLHVFDKGSVQNISHAIVCAYSLGIKPDQIFDHVAEISPVEMRFELKEGINHCKLLNDTYSLDFHSFSLAIDYVNRNAGELKKTVILSDFPELNAPAETFYKQVAKLLNESNVNRLITVGNTIQEVKRHFSGSYTHYASIDEMIKAVSLMSFDNEFILIKGKRSSHFERIVEQLELKRHSTYLKVDLGAIQYNLNFYQSLVKPGTKTMVMVKALAYGSGSREISHLLQFNKVDYLAVAYADEGVELRKLGVRLPIMVMNAVENDFAQLIKYDLQPEVYNFSQLTALINFLVAREIHSFAVHIKFDTGMHRLGFRANEIKKLIQQIEHYRATIKIESVFSHLSCADDPAQDEFTIGQINAFTDITNDFCTALNIQPLRHILNSPGIERFPSYAFDMVRLGIGLHGIGVKSAIQSQLQPVHELVSRISHIQHLEPGEHVGYGRKGKVNVAKTIAVIPIGYADGYFRWFGNGVGKVLINGNLVPVIGNVCMDMTMVDITGIDNIKVGDEVIVFGKELPVSRVASWIQTIPYELLTSVSTRVKRVYVDNV